MRVAYNSKIATTKEDIIRNGIIYEVCTSLHSTQEHGIKSEEDSQSDSL